MDALGLGSVARWFRRGWLQHTCAHTCAGCTERMFPRHMLVLLRDDNGQRQSSEDNWEGRMSAISKPIKQLLRQNEMRDIKLSDVETKISSIELSMSDMEHRAEQNQQSVSEQMSQIQASHDCHDCLQR